VSGVDSLVNDDRRMAALTEKQVQIGSKPVRLWGSPDDASFREIQTAGWDPVLLCAKALLESDACVLDVGSNVGLTAIAFDQLVPDGRIFAFEPSPRNYELLQKNLKENSCSRVEAVNMAVGSSTGEVSFFDTRAYGAGSFAMNDVAQLAARHHSGDLIKVPSVSIDDFVEDRGLDRVDLIKIDVEGFELDVLEGARKTLATHRPITILEFNSYCFITHTQILPTVALERIAAVFPHLYVIRGPGRLRPLRDHHDHHEFLHDNINVHRLDDLVGCFDRDGVERLEAAGEQPASPKRPFRQQLRNRLVAALDRLLQ
jgi:FkbM family methyltransferase